MESEQPIPTGWSRKKIGSFVSFEYGKSLTSKVRNSTGSIPVYGSNGIVGYHTECLIDKPCLIIGRKGAAGAVHKSLTPCWPIDTTYYVVPPDDISLSYLFYLFSSLDLQSLDRSTAIPGLNRQDAYAIEVPIPPRPEQERIVAKIEELFTQLDAGTAALRRVQAGLKRYKASVLKAACEGRLVPQDPSDEPAEELLRRLGKKPLEGEDLPPLPKGWCWAKVGEISETTSGGTPSRSHSEYYRGNIPWVKSGELKDGIITNIEESITDEGLKNSSAKIFPKGTVVVALYGATVGRTGILGIDASTNQAVCAIFPYGDSFFPKYMFYWLQSKRQDLINMSVGGAQPNISQGIIRVLDFPLPPIPEQRRIVAEVERRLSVANEIEQVVAAALARSARLRQSILKRAFEGRL